MEQQSTNEQAPCLGGAAPAVKVKRKYVRKSSLPPPPQVVDARGVLWRIRETRATEHGFDLFFGHPMPRRGVKQKPGPKGQVIPTRELVDYWRQHSSDSRACFRLPACYDSLRRLYLGLGFKLVRYAAAPRPNPLADLKKLSVSEFTERYKMPMSLVIRWRAILLDRLNNPRKRSTRAVVMGVLQSSLTNREAAEGIGLTACRVSELRRNLLRQGKAYSEIRADKWNTPAALAILGSGDTTAQMAQALGVSKSHAYRLRKSLESTG
jgi:hypothetical protein